MAGLLRPASTALPLCPAARGQPCHRTPPRPHAMASRTVEAMALHRPQEQAESSIKSSGKDTKNQFRTDSSTLTSKLPSLHQHINQKLPKHFRTRQRLNLDLIIKHADPYLSSCSSVTMKTACHLISFMHVMKIKDFRGCASLSDLRMS